MKKIIEIIRLICLLIITICMILIVINLNNKNNIYDVNRDGVVDSADLLDIRLYLLSH